MTAAELQKLLGVPDLKVIAHGYTFQRNTVDFMFFNGRLDRHQERKRASTIEWIITQVKEPIILSLEFSGIKRFYKRNTNAKLIELCEAFGNPLPLTD